MHKRSGVDVLKAPSRAVEISASNGSRAHLVRKAADSIQVAPGSYSRALGTTAGSLSVPQTKFVPEPGTNLGFLALLTDLALVLALLTCGCQKPAPAPVAPGPAPPIATRPAEPVPQAAAQQPEAAPPPPARPTRRSAPQRAGSEERWFTAQDALARALPLAQREMPAAKLFGISNRGLIHAGMEDDAMRAGTDLPTGKARFWVVDFCVPSKPGCVRVDVTGDDAIELSMETIGHPPFRVLPAAAVDSAKAAACVQGELERQLAAGAPTAKYKLSGTPGQVEVTVPGRPAFPASELVLTTGAFVDPDRGQKPTWILALGVPSADPNEAATSFAEIACDASTWRAVERK